MPQSIETMHPQMGAAYLRKLEDAGNGIPHRQLFRIVYFSITTDEENENQLWVHKVTRHTLAANAEEAREKLMRNEPESYPITEIMLIAPVQPDIPEDSMLEVIEGTANEPPKLRGV